MEFKNVQLLKCDEFNWTMHTKLSHYETKYKYTEYLQYILYVDTLPTFTNKSL